MKRAFLILVVGGAAALFIFKEQLEDAGVKLKWKNPDGRNMFDVLKDSVENLYSRDLFGDGRKNHAERIDQLEKDGIVTFDHGVKNDSNNGAILSDFANTDAGTKQYLAQTECRIAVMDYGLDPAKEMECRDHVVRRGVYSFNSGGVPMAVTISPNVTSGKPEQVTTDNNTIEESGNWQEG